MTEPKPIASLSASLLARKGTARPAMRRAYMPTGTAPTLSPAVQYDVQDDLGWNDMGAEEGERAVPPLKMAGLTSAHPAASTPATTELPHVVEQRNALIAKFADEGAPAAIPSNALPVVGKARNAKAAFTLRLDPARHLRLRLACAVMNHSAQQIVTQALDAFLNGQPDLEKLARQVPDGGTAQLD
jgi:hypothetical protein